MLSFNGLLHLLFQVLTSGGLLMTICGIEMSGSIAILALINGTKSSFSHLDVEPRKLKLANDADPDEVRAFRDSLFAFFRENSVTLIAIKKRGKKGNYAGGPIGFKLEGIAQLYEDCPAKLVAPQTISAALRKHTPSVPESLRKYQHIAFQTAFSVLK
jgi:hypothetical protein